MRKVRAIADKAGLSLHELGVKMGYPADSARKSVWQFFQGHDPRISVLRRFAEAMGIPLEELVRSTK